VTQQPGKVVRVSDEVYAIVVAGARFGESFDTALRRALKVPEKKAPAKKKPAATAAR
jgi:negative regulator of replication initiation